MVLPVPDELAVEPGAEGTEALGDREKHCDGLGAHLDREDLAHRQVGGGCTGRGEEEDHAPACRLRHRVEGAGVEQKGAPSEEYPGEDVRAGDHLPSPNGVEEMPDGERTDEVSQSKEDE